MSGHTNEEWGVEPDGGNLMVCTDLLEICTIQPVDRGGIKSFYLGDETIANAHLIAAAPDLLEALEMAVAEYEKLPHSLGYEFTHLPAMRDAIAKARGEK